MRCYKEIMTKNDRKAYKSSTINKQENSKIARLKGVQVTIWNTHYFAWCVVNNSVRAYRQMASQFLYLPWICLADGALGRDGLMIDIEIGR